MKRLGIVRSRVGRAERNSRGAVCRADRKVARAESTSGGKGSVRVRRACVRAD